MTIEIEQHFSLNIACLRKIGCYDFHLGASVPGVFTDFFITIHTFLEENLKVPGSQKGTLLPLNKV